MKRQILLVLVGINLMGCKAILTNHYIKSMDKYVDKIPPAFSLPDYEGNIVSLSDFKGKLVYLDFWATWCGPCIGEIPYSDSLQTRFEGFEDVVFVNIALDEDYDQWKTMIRERNIRGINLIDTTLNLEQQYHVDALPTYVLIGKDGEVLGHHISSPSEGGAVDYVLYKGLQGDAPSESIKSLIKEKYSSEDSLWLRDQILNYPTHFKATVDPAQNSGE